MAMPISNLYVLECYHHSQVIYVLVLKELYFENLRDVR